MSNVAFYLKYRPQSLSELVGQENVKQILTSAFEKQRLSHAYLFSGPRGTGKTSTARILAKMVNCESSVIPAKAGIHKQESDGSPIRSGMTMDVPCNKCSNCLTITDGSNLDLIEIDAASNRGIEDIRSLREKIKLSPTNSKKKVYIIDEVHMLTPEAFNALLKTLEEPPSHALFILATTDAQKLPQTILSRVQRLDFTLASNEDILKALQKIVTEEKINIDNESLKLVAKKAEGSFRDAIKYLEQVSLMEDKITVEILEKNLNASNAQVILDLLKTLSKKDTTSALSLIIKQTEKGVDIKELILSLMEAFRNLVFIKNNLVEIAKVNYSERYYLELGKIAENFENKDLVSNLDFLQKALEKMKTTSIPSLPLELAVVEICSDQVVSVAVNTSPVIANEVKQSSWVINPTQIAALRQAQGKLPSNDKFEKLEEQIHPQTSILKDPPSTINHPSSNSDSSDDILKLKDKWTLVLETIRPFNFSLEALLRSSNLKECNEIQVILEVPYSFHQRILEAPKNRDLLESVISDVLGRTIKISTELGVRNPIREDIANIEVAPDDEIIRVAAEIFSSDSIN